jgi:hypothetical protein
VITLTVDEIIALHSKLTAATGGSGGLRDKGLLESAVMNCYQTFGGAIVNGKRQAVLRKVTACRFGQIKSNNAYNGVERD